MFNVFTIGKNMFSIKFCVFIAFLGNVIVVKKTMRILEISLPITTGFVLATTFHQNVAIPPNLTKNALFTDWEIVGAISKTYFKENCQSGLRQRVPSSTDFFIFWDLKTS